jgi:hypothetical protein
MERKEIITSGTIRDNRLISCISSSLKNEVKEKSESQRIISCILPHKKNAIQAKDKIKPGSAASLPGLSIVLSITPNC